MYLPVRQQVTSSGTTTTTLYLSNLEEVAITGSTTTNTAYFYANGQRIALSVNGAISYLGDDGLGSATTTLDSGGNGQASALYLPYGGVRYTSGTMPTQRLFTGQVSDASTSGLDYYNARSYDPALGQFVSADTYDAGGLNRYAYVDDNPTSRTDQNGHCIPWCIGIAVGAIVGAAVSYVSQVSNNMQNGKTGLSAYTSNINLGAIAATAALGAGAGLALTLNPGGSIAGIAGTVAGIGLGALAGGHIDAQTAFQQMAAGAIGGAVGGPLADAGGGALAQFVGQGVVGSATDGLSQVAAMMSGEQSTFNPVEMVSAGVLAGSTTLFGSFFRRMGDVNADNTRFGGSVPFAQQMSQRAAIRAFYDGMAHAWDARFQFGGNILTNWFFDSLYGQNYQQEFQQESQQQSRVKGGTRLA